MNSLISKLDLQDFIASFKGFFARDKEIYLLGDDKFYEAFLKELDSLILPPLPKVENLDISLTHLQKFGNLKLEEIVEFGKIITFFLTLKHQNFVPKEGVFRTWIDKIVIPSPISLIASYFNTKGEIKEGVFEELDQINHNLFQNKRQITQQFSLILSYEKLAPFLIDRQIHYINGNECLLLKAGFNHAIKGMIISRSQNGFFYLCPEEILRLKEKETQLKDKLHNILFQICKDISKTFQKHLLFLKFINQAFDIFDHLNARILFAKSKNLEFLFRTNTQEIVLVDYAHPNLKNPKLLNIALQKNLLIITGVNAGGKTILLKSILACAFLSKYLIPQKINATKSKIGFFKHIEAIISDPQNSKNDISTFAGRMLEISKVLHTEGMLLAIDEIELGTDSDEASSLYKEILEQLLQKNNKIIITTHHKRLASLMISNPKTELYAALFDEKNQIPTFSFLKGTIGKSYAFETAMRYHIPHNLIQKAKNHYGEDKERLNLLIEKSTTLEMELHQKQEILNQEILQCKKKQEALDEIIWKNKEETRQLKNKLEKTYQDALNLLKKEAKTIQQIHQNMNEANKILQSNPMPQTSQNKNQTFQVGDFIKYHNQKGIIKAKNNHLFLIECDGGLKLKVNAKDLQHAKPSAPKNKTTQSIAIPKNQVGISLDLHGLRVEEALEKTDKFLSDCLLAGYDEVLIYHGIGGGILAKAIKEFLKTHPKVIKFEDAPPQMGGFGAKLVWL